MKFMVRRNAARHFGWILACALVTGVHAAGELRPYVLAWEGEAQIATVLDNTRRSLTAVGFELLGEYRPFADAHVLVVTAPLLQKLVAEDRNAVFIAALSVAVTRVGQQVQVSYPNPAYYAKAYRLSADVAPLVEALHASLGQVRAFGSQEGVPAQRLLKYQYSYGMEYFDDQLRLAEYAGQAQALKAIEQGFAANPQSFERVYRLDMPQAGVSVFGVGILDGSGADTRVHAVLDHGPERHIAQLPYRLVVSDGRVSALHPRFRLALNFPDIKMVGAHSFMQLRDAPEAIQAVLQRLATGG